MIGIDIDYNIIGNGHNNGHGNSHSHSHSFLIDYNTDWDYQLELFGNDSIKGPFDTLICKNNIHNVNGDVFMKYINMLTKNGSKFIIQFLDNDKLKLLLKDLKYIANKENFVRYYGSNMKRIKYYYSHCHRHPIIEKVVTKEDIVEMCGNDWTIKKYNKVNEPSTATNSNELWQKYLGCFSELVLEKSQ
jgi:hypothetical protein